VKVYAESLRAAATRNRNRGGRELNRAKEFVYLGEKMNEEAKSDICTKNDWIVWPCHEGTKRSVKATNIWESTNMRAY